jgi:hypothetical protein
MAVPTITSVTPSNGLPSGRARVEIIGTNFRTPPVHPPAGSDPPLTGPIGGEWLRTVSVTIDGRESDDVVPVSSTLLWVITPKFLGLHSDLPKASDVVVTNLDDDGVPIGGETVTDAGGFTFQRQDLTAQSDVTWVTRNLLWRFKRNIVANVACNTSIDYSDDPASGLTAIGAVPAILLLGPDVEDDSDAMDVERQFPVQSGNDKFIGMRGEPVAMLFRVIAISNGKAEAQNLVNLLRLDLRKRPSLTLETAPGSGTYIELELHIDESWIGTDDFGADIHSYETGLRIRGLLLDESYGVQTTGIPVSPVIAPESGDEDEVPVLQVQEGLI